MSINPDAAIAVQTLGHQSNHVVLVLEDHLESRSDLDEVLAQNGYGVIGTDNGRDAARHARQTRPDLLLIDLDVPLLFELVAARQILKHAQLWQIPVVIVTHEDAIDPLSIMEVGARRNEYVTRLADYDQIQDLLDYLLPVIPRTRSNSGSETIHTGDIELFERSISPDVFQPT